MTTATQRENNVKAGIFVLIALAVGITVIFILGDLWNKFFGPPANTYHVSFTVVDGVGYLGTGSVVRVGGIDVGFVESVTLDTEQNPIEGVDVVFTVPSDVALYSNATVSVVSGLISSESAISISSVGWDEAVRPTGVSGQAGTRLANGDSLIGTSAGGMLGSMLGAEASARLTEILNSVADISGRLRVDGALLDWALGQGPAEDVTTSIAELEALFGRLRVDWEGEDGHGGWSKDISEVMDKAEEFARIVETVDAFVVENEAAFNSIVANANATMSVIRSESVPQLNTMLQQGEEAILDARKALGEINAHLPLWSDRIGTLLADLNLAGQQLDLLLQEVRNAPWRLLYQPSEQAVSNELLYEASRNFLFGAADLKSASASLDRVLQAGGAELPADDRALQVVRDNLAEAVTRYEQAQRQLADILHGNTTPPTAP